MEVPCTFTFAYKKLKLLRSSLKAIENDAGRVAAPLWLMVRLIV
jgi:hypothetical protein